MSCLNNLLLWAGVLFFLLASGCVRKSELTEFRGTYKGTCVITQTSPDPVTGELVSMEEELTGASFEIIQFNEEGNGDGVVDCESGCGSTSEYPYFSNELYENDDSIHIVHRAAANEEYILTIFKGEGRVIVRNNQTFPSGPGGVFIVGEYLKE